ncbi:MAG TPA: phasin family protein [Azospirillum sp.]
MAQENAQRRTGDDADPARRPGERPSERPGERMADLAEQTGNAAADTARRAFGEMQSTERAARNVAESSLGTANQMARDMVERVGNVFTINTPEAQETIRRTTQNMNAVIEANTALSEASQAIWREWLDFAQEAARQQADGMQRVVAARTPHDLVDAQMALLKREVETFLNTASRVSDLSSKAVRQATTRVRESSDEDEEQNRTRQRRRA